MKIWRIQFTEIGEQRYTWRGTFSDAARAGAQLNAVRGVTDVVTEQVNVPTDKEGLVEFLNQVATQRGLEHKTAHLGFDEQKKTVTHRRILTALVAIAGVCTSLMAISLVWDIELLGNIAAWVGIAYGLLLGWCVWAGRSKQ